MTTYGRQRFLFSVILIVMVFFYVDSHIITYSNHLTQYEHLPENYMDQPDIVLAAPDEKTGEDVRGQDKVDESPEENTDGKQQTGSENNAPSSEKKEDSLPPQEGNQPEDTALRHVLGFYVDKEYLHPSSYQVMLNNSDNISSIAPFWYRLSPGDGSDIQERHPCDGFTPEIIKGIVNKAHQKNIEVYMLVHNLLYGGEANGKELARHMLATADTRKAFIDDVERLIKEYGYDGVNIDIENIRLEDRNRFSLLIKELYSRLNPQGYKVTVCVPAKTGDNRSNSWSGPFDYNKIGKYSDLVAIMTYDEHGYSSGPGPIASYEWVRSVAGYAVSQMPRQKILLGMPGYGFDWKVGQKSPTYISYSQAIEIANSRDAKIQWDSKAKVPYFKYWESSGQEHEVWFESSYSLEAKLDIVEEFNIRGIAIWRLGLEDPEVWNMLDKRIKTQK